MASAGVPDGTSEFAPLEVHQNGMYFNVLNVEGVGTYLIDTSQLNIQQAGLFAELGNFYSVENDDGYEVRATTRTSRPQN